MGPAESSSPSSDGIPAHRLCHPSSVWVSQELCACLCQVARVNVCVSVSIIKALFFPLQEYITQLLNCLQGCRLADMVSLLPRDRGQQDPHCGWAQAVKCTFFGVPQDPPTNTPSAGSGGYSLELLGQGTERLSNSYSGRILETCGVRSWP